MSFLFSLTLLCQVTTVGKALGGRDSPRLVVLIFHREDAPFFNRHLDEDDVVAAYAGHAHLLKYVDGPKRLLVVPSIMELRRRLKVLEGTRIDYINYNPEIYPTHSTPEEELVDILGAVKEVKRIADSIGAKLSLTPDKFILFNHGEELAPLVDVFGIQLQRYQRRGDLLKMADSLSRFVREANPEVDVVLQISLAPPSWKRGHLLRDEEGKKLLLPLDFDEVMTQIEKISSYADGIAFLYTRETRQMMKEVVRRLRGR
jgi:hypothetical protein